MVKVTLMDGKELEFQAPLSLAEVAQTISKSLAKKAIAAEVDGVLVDLSYLLEKNSKVVIITAQDPKALEIIRHSAAHLLAQAVKQLYPKAQLAIGPAIENGFYYDFAIDTPFTLEDLSKIEERMQLLAKQNIPVTREEFTRAKALEFFAAKNETYKVELIQNIPTAETLTVYSQAEFADLCRGPHVPSTAFVNVFKLTKLAGAYWRGDVSKPMLQRIYGTAFATTEELKAYLHAVEEAEKRDHRKLGKAMGLFHFQDLAPGMVFWHPKGWRVYQIIEQYIRAKLKDDYLEIRTPQVVDKVLWEKSGHWDNFRNEMFLTSTENREFAIKPMNCPCHVQVYNQGIKSYRDLPLRFSEFGNCHRCEPSGSLHGLMRVRNMVQDDAHIFCTESQIQAEVSKLLSLIKKVYKDFGFEKITYRLALRPENRVGSDESWDKAEEALKEALTLENISWIDAPGEGAFYGPKIECSLADSIGRIWQCGTIQVDFSMPSRLEAQYIAEDGSKKVPVMIHRAILGSFERFIGILIENYAGHFPLWLAPIQVGVLTISEKHNDKAIEYTEFLKKKAVRAFSDLRNEKIGFKIREHTLQKIPYFLVVGDKEIEAQTVSVRSCSGKDLGIMSIEAFFELISQEISNK